MKKLLAVLFFLVASAAAQTVHTYCPLDANCVWAGTSVINNTLDVNYPGIFSDNTQENHGLGASINGINLKAQVIVPLVGGSCCSAMDAIAGGILTPAQLPPAIVTVNGLAGYAEDHCNSWINAPLFTPPGGGGNHCNSVGVSGIGSAAASGAYVWGALFAVNDFQHTVGLTNTGYQGWELDMGSSSLSPTRYNGFDMFGGTVPNGFTMPAGAHAGAITGAAQVNGTASPWPYGIIFSPATTNVAALQLYPVCKLGGGACSSQVLNFTGQNSGNTLLSASISADSSGNLTLTPAANTFVNVVGGLGITGNIQFSTSKGQHIQTQAAQSDIAGTCTVGSGTTCVVALTFAYVTGASCVVTPMTSVGAFYISSPSPPTTITTGFTITYANTGASTWNYICIGNPN